MHTSRPVLNADVVLPLMLLAQSTEFSTKRALLVAPPYFIERLIKGANTVQSNNTVFLKDRAEHVPKVPGALLFFFNLILD